MSIETQHFIIEAALYVTGAILCGGIGWAACRFAHRHEVRDAIDRTHRRIEDRLRRERLGLP